MPASSAPSSTGPAVSHDSLDIPDSPDPQLTLARGDQPEIDLEMQFLNFQTENVC